MTGPRIPRPRLQVWASLWGDSLLLPIVMAFAAGMLLGLVCQDQRLMDERDEARAAAWQALRRASAAQHLAGQWAATCGPVMSLPIESTPEIIPAAGREGAQP